MRAELNLRRALSIALMFAVVLGATAGDPAAKKP